MFKYSTKELAVADKQLEPIVQIAAQNAVEAQQLALDATRLLSCTSDRLDDYKGKGFFKRCWSKLSGKTGALERANQSDLIEMQKLSWRYLTILQENDLMLAHSIVAVKNNLLTLAVKEEETRQQIIELANRIESRFTALEDRVVRLEVATSMHSWLLTLSMFDYDEKYTPYIRLLKVVHDFYRLKAQNWNLHELKYLQKALFEVGLDGKREVTIGDFIDGIITEINDYSVEAYGKLICVPISPDSTELVPSSFALDEIAAPFYASLARIEQDYRDSRRTIEVLADELSISREEAHKKALMSFVKRDGVDTTVSVSLRELAVELLACMGMVAELYKPRNAMQAVGSGNDLHLHRSLSGVQKSFGRFTEYVDSRIIQDTKSLLLWRVGPDKDMTWALAKTWAEGLGNGWRMPTQWELYALFRAGICVGDWGPFKNRGLCVWAEETASASGKAFYFDFEEGIVNVDRKKTYSNTRGFAVCNE